MAKPPLRELLPEDLRKDLTSAEEKLLEAATTGDFASLQTGDAQQDDPAQAEHWGPERTIRAALLFWLYTDPDAAKRVAAKGIRVQGARVVGPLDFEAAVLSLPLMLFGCAMPDGAVLRDTRAASLIFYESHIGAISADRLETKGPLFLRKCATAGEIRLLGAEIGGDLDCSGAKLRNPGGYALNADGVAAKGHVFLNNGFEADGEVRLLGAEIGGDLDCSGAKLRNPGGSTLNADGLTTKGNVFLREGFEAEGEVRLLGAEIGNTLDCRAAKLHNPGAFALNADRLKARGAVFLNGDFETLGEVRLPGAEIGGDLDCSGAKLRNPGGRTLNVDGLTTKGNVFLRDGFEAEGEVRLLGAKISSSFDCRGAKLRSPGGNALTADYLKTTGTVYLNLGFEAEGEVRLLGAEIGNTLDCRAAKLHNLGEVALNASGLTTKGNVFLREGFEAEGEVRLLDAVIGNTLDFSGAKLRNPEKWVLVCERSEVSGALFWTGVSSDGKIDLVHLRVGQLVDDEKSWPLAGRLWLDGFEYGAFASSSPQTADTRLRWLRLQPMDPFLPRPYEQLARALRAMGHDQDARAVLIAKQKDRCRFARLSRAAKTWSRFLGFTIRHGYAPWRAFWFIAFFLLLGWAVFLYASELGIMQPLKEGVSQPLQPFMYSADVFFPFLDLHQEKHWLPDPDRAPPWGFIIRWYLWFHIVMGWVFSTLAVAAFTGLVRKD